MTVWKKQKMTMTQINRKALLVFLSIVALSSYTYADNVNVVLVVRDGELVEEELYNEEESEEVDAIKNEKPIHIPPNPTRKTEAKFKTVSYVPPPKVVYYTQVLLNYITNILIYR